MPFQTLGVAKGEGGVVEMGVTKEGGDAGAWARGRCGC